MPISATNRAAFTPTLDNAKLKNLVHRKTVAWAKIYAAEPDGPELIRSMLLGAEAIVREHLGLMPSEMRATFGDGTVSRAYHQGRDCLSTVDLYSADIFADRLASADH